MDIDPIVLLAYVSVSINVITMIAACVSYAIFHVRKHRRKRSGGAAPDPSGAPDKPIFLRRYPVASAFAAALPAEPMTVELAAPGAPTFADPR